MLILLDSLLQETPHIMSLLVTSLRRVSGLRMPVLRSLSTETRVPVIRDNVWSQVRPSLVSVSPLQNQIRCYSGPDPLNMKFIHDRVMLVLNLFDKIDNNKLTPESHFLNDLGLDSLDHVEIMLMIEDEFGFEIPDDHGERLVTPAMIVKYVADHEDIYE